MSEINIGGIQPYTISLDNLDFAHLSKYVQNPNTEKIPLWTKRCLNGETNYYQVQIMTSDLQEDSYSESSETYTCHICNVHVPIMFTKEHNASVQHETFKKIFQSLLERVSKQIDFKTIDYDREIDNEAYYCAPCSKVIKFENKLKHDSSDCHLNAGKKMTIANEFYKIIKDNITSEVTVANNEHTDEENDYDELYRASSNTTLDSDDNDSDDLSQIMAGNLQAKPAPVKEDNMQSFQDYLKEMIIKFKLKIDLPEVNGDNVFLVSPNGVKVTVSREHYHSYRQLKNSIYCQLCKMWISEDTRPHDVSECHVRNILLPLNENFARTMDAVSSHCVPCNEVILTNSNHHTLNDTHKKIIIDTRTSNTDKTFCSDCNIYIDTHNFAVHIKSNKHLNVLMGKHSVSKFDDGDIFFLCNICDMTLHKNDVNNHVNSKTHNTNRNNDCTAINNKNNNTTAINNKNNNTTAINNKNNNTTAINNKNNYTAAINNKNNNTATINNKNNNTAAMNNTNTNSSKVNDSKYCDVCKVKVPAGGMKIHVAGKPHKTVISQLHKNEPKRNTVHNGVRDGSVAHGSTSNHNSIASSSSTLSPVSSHLDNVTKTKLRDYYKLLFYTDDGNTKVSCQICDLNIPYNDRKIIEHFEGRNHSAAENELVNLHTLDLVQSGYHCDCCGITTNNFLEHINSRSHTLKLIDEYETDKAEIRKYVYENNDKGALARSYRELYKNILKHNSIYKLNDHQHYCDLCRIKLTRISEIDHVLGERHRLNVDY